jgi:protein HIRA/HIR1
MGSGEEEDWLLLNEVDAGFNLHHIEVGKMEKRLISQLSWSPSGTYLATTYDKLIIWQLSGGVLSMFRTY